MIRTLFKKKKKKILRKGKRNDKKKKIITKVLIHSRYIIITDYIHILYIVLYLHFGKTPYSI